MLLVFGLEFGCLYDLNEYELLMVRFFIFLGGGGAGRISLLE